jgi:phage tail tube protein FII
MKTNIVEQLKEFHVYLKGSILLGNIEEINVLHHEQKNKIDVELKVRGIHPDVNSKLVNLNKPLDLKVRGTLENDQGETVQARWSFVGKVLQPPFKLCGMTTCTINVRFREHYIDDEEQYYIDFFKDIHRIDGVDRLAATRAAIGI